MFNVYFNETLKSTIRRRLMGLLFLSPEITYFIKLSIIPAASKITHFIAEILKHLNFLYKQTQNKKVFVLNEAQEKHQQTDKF